MTDCDPFRQIERILVDEREAARLLSISPRTMFTLAAARKIRTVRIGRSKRYDLADLHEYIELQKEGA